MDNWRTLNILFPGDDRQLGFNLRLNPDLAVHRQMIADFRQKALYGEALANFLYNVLRPGDTVIEVGAHIGYFSLLASAFVGRSGFVYAFEAERRNFVQLQANIAINRVGNVQPYEQALGALTADVPFYINLSGNDGAHSLVPPDSRGRQTAYRSDTTNLATLDSVIGDPGSLRIRVLKVTVAGAEPEVLRGAAGLLRKRTFDFVISHYDARSVRRVGGSETAFRAFMADFGYDCYGLMPSADLVHVPAGETLAGPDDDLNVTLVFAQPDTVRRFSEGQTSDVAGNHRQ